MTLTHARTAASWLLLTVMVTLFVAATWHLAQGVVQSRVEGLMSGGGLMFIAVITAWLRVSLGTLGDSKGHIRARTDWMAEPA